MPNKAKLYTNSKGYAVTRHSHSGGDLWTFCARKYLWQRPHGWQEREQRASMHFGKCIEGAAQSRMLNTSPGPEAFAVLWGEFAPDFDARCAHGPEGERPCASCAKRAKWNRDLTYSEKEKDWARMREMGIGLMRLFDVRLPSLPFQGVTERSFQRELRKEVFPNSEYSGLEFTAYLDIISSPPWDHPLLPPIEDPGENGKKTRPLITDMKATSASIKEENAALVGLDQQLLDYAWASAIPDVAFLLFVKAVPEVKAGSRVSLLIDREPYKAGAEVIVGDVAEITDIPEKVAWLLPDDAKYDEMRQVLNGLRGKERGAKQTEFLAQFATMVGVDSVTTQRIQFLAARVSRERATRAGYKIARQMVDISNETKRYEAGDPTAFPEQGGVRFPNAKCLDCAYRGLCLDKPELRDVLLVKAGEEWLDE